MTKVFALALFLLFTPGCAGIYRAIAGEENPDVVEIRALVRPSYPGCADTLKIEEGNWRQEMPWLVTGCTGKLRCLRREGHWACFNAPPKISDWGDEYLPDGFQEVSVVAAQTSGCKASEARITMLVPPERGAMGTYTATLCGRTFQCLMSMGRRGIDLGESKCSETVAAPEASAELNAGVARRLALETGCPAANIRIDGSPVINGAERSARLIACGKAYVCTTAAGRTECRPALDSAQPPPTPVEQPPVEQQQPAEKPPQDEAPRRHPL